MASKYHVRSISLPSRSHPTTVRVEEELTGSNHGSQRQLLQHQTQSAEVYLVLKSCMIVLMIFSKWHQPNSYCLNTNKRNAWMSTLLDGSVKLLDICGISRDFMLQVKEHVYALQSALRRRKGDSSIEASIANYTCFSKKMKKDAKKLITQLKQADNKIETSQLLEQDQHLAAVIRVLRQVCAMNMSIFQSLLVFLAVPVSKAKSNVKLIYSISSSASLKAKISWIYLLLETSN